MIAVLDGDELRAHCWPVMPNGGLLTLLIATLLVGIIPAAYAYSPDPSWVAGYWDDDDFDNTVVFITGPCAVDVTVPVHARPLVVATARLEPMDPVACPALPRTSLQPRAPPRIASSRCA